MKKMQPGVTGFIPWGGDYFPVLERYAKMGYKAFEGGGLMFRGDPVENTKRMHDMGLQLMALSTSVQGDAQPDVKDLVEKARIIGAPWIMIYHSGATSWRFADREFLPDYDESMREIEKMNTLANQLHAEGLQLAFHNHDQELLTHYNGVPLLWLMAANCEHLKFEIDLGWAHYADVDPVKLIHRLGDRIVSLHVKDYLPGDNFERKPLRTVRVPRYCAPGAGVLDLYHIFEAACEEGIEWAIIEQDMQHHLTTEESVQAAYYNMKETGFIA